MTIAATRLSAIGTTLLVVLLAGCGGGGSSGSAAAGSTSGGSSGGTTGGTSGSTYVPGQFLAASTYAAKCANPRSGTDPLNNNMPYPDVQGTTTDENNYLRSWTHQLYLWFEQVPDLDPSLYATPAYFQLLKTSATTPSG